MIGQLLNQNSQLSTISPLVAHRRFPRSLLAVSTIFATLMAIVMFASYVLPTPFTGAGFVFSRVTCTLGFLVTFVGAVVVRYTDRYLDGDKQQSAFGQYLVISVLSALVMMMADNLLVLVGGWSITSVGLHYLLTYYQNEPDAVVVARKKFLISRLGDIALLLAIFSIYRTWGTFSLTQFFDLLSKSNQVPEFSVWMICLAAILKSAQFPFHSWLPDTLAAPTPVSALMHAGIINGGGALLLKFAPALIRVPTAGLFLAVIGSITMAFGMVSMWSQTSVKRKLAWSTVSQMGFMTAELGMAAFAAALLHIVSHGLYKATAFLGSGEVEAASVTPNRLTGWKNLAVLIVGIILSMPLQIFAHGGHMTPQQWSIAVMTGIASGHFLIALQAHLAQRGAGFIITIASMIVSTQFIALLSSTLLGFATYCIHLPLPPASWPSLLAAIIPVITLALLSAFRAFEADIRRSDFGKALSVHAQNGFYVGLYADKAVAKIWTSFSRKAH